jgi:hypothetical protein
VTLKHWPISPARVIVAVTILLAVVHAAGIFARGVRPRVVRGDALHYYVQLRSPVFDHDLDFENDYVGLYTLDFKVSVPPPGWTWSYERTPNGHVRNFMPVGPAVAWAPLFFVVTGTTWMLSLAGLGSTPDGFGLAFQFVPDVCGVIAGGLAMWFAYLFASTLHGARAALGAAVALLIGSPLIYYTVVAPAYSHSLSAMGASAFVLYWWKTRDRIDIGRFAALGALAGLTALIRWQDGLLSATVLVDVIVLARARDLSLPGAIRFALPRLAAAGLAALLAFSPQMFVWQVLYGQPLTIPQGAGFMRWTESAIGEVLFSPHHGLFAWTPLTAVALAGLALSWKKQPRLVLTLGLFFVASTYVNGAVSDWWAGEAFGARRYLSCFPIFVVGLAGLLAREGIVGSVARLATVALAVANLLLLVQYQVFMIGMTALTEYPKTWYVLWVDRFVLPFRLIRHLLRW